MPLVHLGFSAEESPQTSGISLVRGTNGFSCLVRADGMIDEPKLEGGFFRYQLRHGSISRRTGRALNTWRVVYTLSQWKPPSMESETFPTAEVPVMKASSSSTQ